MASTYSNLKIQLMATGENNSTWGTVTNTNLGTALEEAITGSVDVTFASGDVTLTLTNTNATQSARNLRLNCTGTTGGARNLILGSGCQIEKIYIVNNGCADAITIKNTTGTGIAVPAGKTMYVFNNGTNVVDAITHLTSLTLASALPIASGGTGATTLNGLTFTGENITNINASNISSGTLANARTTASSSNGASTIVARGSSGEFSAGVITADGSGLTALNASNVSTGTLAVSRGGIGTGSLTANNVLLGNGTSSPQFVAPGASGNVLTSNGTTWISQAPSPFTTGMIMLWSGSVGTIPSGWALCNGSNGTPDLRDRFIVGAGSTYAVNATGGSTTLTPTGSISVTGTALTEAQMPKHYHLMLGPNAVSSPQGSGSSVGVYGGGTPDDPTQAYGTYSTGGNAGSGSQTTGTSNGDTHTHSATFTGSSGSILPPYYALAYIMKL